MSEELERIKELIDDLVNAAQDNTDRHTRTSQLRLKSARHNVEFEFSRLQAELDGDDLMAREAELFKPEYIRQLEAENVRLQAQVATLERIIEREAEKTAKAGQP